MRHKSFSLARESPDEAVLEMEMMDYGFHLFTDLCTGEDSVLYRSGPTGCRVAQVHPRPRIVGEVAVPLTVSEIPAPRMHVAEAKRPLDITGVSLRVLRRRRHRAGQHPVPPLRRPLRPDRPG